ncbi:hypothetical protein MY3296_004292 [Beauveria thailandica]
MIPITYHPEPRQTGPTNSHSAAFSYPFDCLKGISRGCVSKPLESRATLAVIIAHSSPMLTSPLALHLVNVQIPSPALSPVFLPDPVLLITHHVPPRRAEHQAGYTAV